MGDKNDKKISAFFVFMAAFLWGLIGFFTTNLSTAGFTNMQIIFIRASITTLFLGITLLIRGKNEFKVKFKDLWMFFGMGFVSFCLFNFCYFTSMHLNNSLSTACILMYTAPVFVMLMSLILFKEKITKIKVVSVILAILGCFFVCGIGKITPIGFLFGIGSGIGYTTSMIALNMVTGGLASGLGVGAAGSVGVGQLAATAGVMGFSSGTENAWVDGATTGKGLLYGAASGAWEATQWAVGAKINQAHYDPNMPIEIEIRKNIINVCR